MITGLSLEGYNGGADHNVSEQDGTQYRLYHLYDHNQFGAASFLHQRAECIPCIFTSGRLRGAFWEALEEAYEYHAVQVKNEEDTGARRQEQEKQEREIEIMDQRMRSQRQARETTNRYMKRLAGLTIKEYTPAALSAEARGHLERIEARTIDFCSEQGEHAAESLDKAEEVLQTVRSFTEN